jgi:hypothetical protein
MFFRIRIWQDLKKGIRFTVFVLQAQDNINFVKITRQLYKSDLDLDPGPNSNPDPDQQPWKGESRENDN